MMVFPLYVTLVVGIVTLAIWYAVSRWQQKKYYPPGPFPLPLIGNLPILWSKKAKTWVIFDELRKTHGDVFTVFFATEPIVILGSLEVVKEAFLTKQNDFAGRPTSYTFDYATRGGTDIAGGQYGPVWRRQRKIALSALRKLASGECLEDLVHQSFQQLSVQLEKVVNTGQKFNPENSLNHVFYNVIFSMVFGKVFKYDDSYVSNFMKLQDELNDVLVSGVMADMFPVFKYIPTKAITSLHKASDALHELVSEIYEKHKDNFNKSTSENPKDVVDFMLQTIQEVEKEEGVEGTEGLTKEHYKGIIADIFHAGIDTSRISLGWIILFITSFPECKKKIQEEVDSILRPDEKVCMEHRKQLPYTEAFIHEALRFRPIGPLGVPRKTTCDTSVGGYQIPAGTTIMPNIWAMHMDKEVWGDPETFRPERFLDDNGKIGPRISSWMPFSTGRRVCVGETVAKAELHILVASIARKYDFSAPPGALMDISPRKTAEMMIPNEYEVIITQRS